MFTKRIVLFKLLGFEVKIDLSWLLLALLVAWTLAVGVFPQLYPGLSPGVYWGMGAAGVVVLLFSIVFHELSHSLVARHYGFPIKGITLFVFGGVAEMDEEPPTARSEFFMAAAGPLSSGVIALFLYALFRWAVAWHWPIPLQGVAGYLSYINVLLAVFNLLPAFPLDGGRVLRAALWGWKDNFRWATRIASRIGAGFGLAMIIIGVIAFITGYIVSGVWWVLIGLFLRAAAGMSYQQIMVRDLLAGVPVRRFMSTRTIAVPPAATVRELVEDYIYKYHYKMFPVEDQGRLAGCIGTDELKAFPREEWDHKQVRDIMSSCTIDNTIPPDMDTMKAWTRMRASGKSRLLVVDHGRLVGIVTQRDLMDFLSLKLDLEK